MKRTSLSRWISSKEDNTELGILHAECRDFTRRGCDAQDKVQPASRKVVRVI